MPISLLHNATLWRVGVIVALAGVVVPLAKGTSCFAQSQMPGEEEQVFVTPQELVAANRRAIANKDWYLCFSCYASDIRGAILRDMLGTESTMHDPILTSVVRRHLRATVDDFLKSAGRNDSGVPHISDAEFYGALKRRADVRTFVAEFCGRLYELRGVPFADFGTVTRIEIKGNRAVGFYELRSIPPAARTPAIAQGVRENAVNSVPTKILQPLYFRTEGKGWYFAGPEKQARRADATDRVREEAHDKTPPPSPLF